MQPYARMIPADYCDNRKSLRCHNNGAPLPNARDLSLFLTMRNPPNQRVNHERTHFMTTFGQYVTHTGIMTPDEGGKKAVTCDCKNQGTKCVVTDVKGDAVFDDIDCVFIVRSSGTLSKGIDNKIKKEQMNQLTGLFHSGGVYGFNDNHLAAVRVGSNSGK
jgi:hypothetical protein